MMPLLKLEPSWLPPGTMVGPWKVQAYHRGGSFGAVFRAVLAGRAHRGPVALKMACLPFDPRFKREAELLSRIHHPSVPKLLWSGEWKHPDGAAYPYLVMEWVEGVSLYEWAERFIPSSQEASRVLAQVARALVATHAVDGVHRDVKGANILVSTSSGRAFLTDFGAGSYPGAEPLTREGLPPGTDNYRTPEAWEFELHRPRNSTATYQAQPADDVFALGVSAYRLVTGRYLPPVEVREEQRGPGRLEWTPPQPPQELNARVELELSALILRMLSVRPEERPTASELAKALEKADKNPAPGADQPLFAPKERKGAAAEASAEQREAQELEEAHAPVGWALARVHVPAWMLACAVFVGVVGALAVGWALRHGREGGARIAGEDQSASSPVGLGDTGLTVPAAQGAQRSTRDSLGLPMPKEPLEGQRRAPDCRPPLEITINGGCWVEARHATPPCGDVSYEWKGSCYVPNYHPPRQPTSEPP